MNDSTIEQLRAALAKHDWYYEFSDDYSIYRNGKNSADTIYRLIMRAKSEGLEEIAEEMFKSAIPKR